MKICTSCGEEKDKSCFYKHKNEPHGLQYWCKDCRKVADKKYYKNNREWALEREWRRALRRRYNITHQIYYEMMDKQNGVCAVCKQPEQTHRNLCVDHDHSCCVGDISCGKCIRGLLCSKCNRGLGLLGDSAYILQNALEYIKNGNIN